MSTAASALDDHRLLELKDHVVRHARELGHWAREFARSARAGDADLGVSSKTSPGDVVTIADAEVQRRLVSALRAVAPDIGVVGEEGLDESEPGAPTWVIDPIDGTHNFVRGYPGFCVSVGLVVAGESVLGVIYDEVDDAVYWAVRGHGAWRDGERLRRGPTRDMANALIGTNFTADSARSDRDQHVFVELSRRSAGVRASGAACRDFCHLASGRSDLFWQFGLKAWDVAAGVVIAREAGCSVAFADAPADWVRADALATFVGEPALVEEALAVLGEASAAVAAPAVPAAIAPRHAPSDARLDALRGGLIASCQPVRGGAFDAPEHVARFAAAALDGGAVGLRVEGLADVAAVRRTLDDRGVRVPLIGLVKRTVETSDVLITPEVGDVEALLAAGADVIAFDATLRHRPVGVDALVRAIHAGGALAMADVATADDGRAAHAAGADLVATTLSGYVAGTPDLAGPDLGLVAVLAAHGARVVAEGRIASPSDAAQALRRGAFAVTVGTAFSRPERIVRSFVQALAGETTASAGDDAGATATQSDRGRRT